MLVQDRANFTLELFAELLKVQRLIAENRGWHGEQAHRANQPNRSADPEPVLAGVVTTAAAPS
jgi:hypothetical protein